MPSYIMDVMPVQSEDQLCIFMPFYSFGKQVKNLKFYPIAIEASKPN